MTEHTQMSTQDTPAYEAPAPHQGRQHSTNTTFKDTNTFAVISVILAFTVPIAGIVFGHISLGQIKRNGDEGRALALTGLIVGYASVILIALVVVLYIAFLAITLAPLGAAFGDMGGGMGGFGSDSGW